MVCADVHVLLFFPHQLDDLANLFGDILVALPFVGAQAAGAVFDAGFGIAEIAAAVFAQGVEGAVAEDAGEGLRVGVLVAGEVFTLFVLEKIVVGHDITSLKLIPGEFVGWGSVEGQLFARFGMAEAQEAGPEGDLAVALVGAVFPVAHQGEVPGGELAADLVGAARHQLDADLAEFFGPGQKLVVQDGFLDILARLRDHIGLALGLVPGQEVHQGASGVVGGAVEDGGVFLMEDPVPDLLAQVRGSPFGPGQDHQAGDHPVQPVDGADILIPQGLTAQVRDTARLVGGQDPGRLDADHEGRVDVNDFKVGHGKTSFYSYV